MRSFTRSVFVALVLVVAAGCGQTRQTSPTETPPGTLQVALRRATSCADLEAMLKQDALAKLNRRIDDAIAAIDGYGPGYLAPVAPSKSGGADESGAAPKAADYSETTTQVAGVDEADFVKTDGKYVYVLHGDRLLVVDAWPPTSLATAASIPIEGQPSEMFVTESQVVVFSTVDGSGIYAAAGVTPRPAYQDGYAWGYGVKDASGPAPAPAPGGDIAPPSAWTPLTKVTVLGITGAASTTAAELYFEGTYASSRRVAERVRVVLGGAAYGPAIPAISFPNGYPQTKEEYVAALEKQRTDGKTAIEASTASDWLPYAFVRSGDSITATLAGCDELYVPTAGSTEYGMTRIQSIDLAAPTELHGVGIVGRTDTVFSTASTMVLAAHAWVEVPIAVSSSGGGGGETDGGTPIPPPDAGEPGEAGVAEAGTESIAFADSTDEVSVNRTHVHAFDLASDPAEPRYVASASVQGSVLDQFSFDEKDGAIRVAVTDERVSTKGGASSRDTHVYVLRPVDDVLQIVGDTGALAPNERIYATRFVGDTAYVVTFRQVDPLFVVDLSTPTAPKVLGELTIPGFSEYMHPIDPGHLLTIGKETMQTPSGGVVTTGLALQIFDVTVPTAPALAAKYVFEGDEYGYSEAEHSHKAFTWFASRGLLAFPYVSYPSDGSGVRSALEVFRASVDGGIVPLGAIRHDGFFQTAPMGWCGGTFGVEIRRGVFLEDYVCSVSYGGIAVNAVADLTTPIATEAFPAPQEQGIPGCKEGGPGGL